MAKNSNGLNLYGHFQIRLKERYDLMITKKEYINLSKSDFFFLANGKKRGKKGIVIFNNRKILVIKNGNRLVTVLDEDDLYNNKFFK